MTVCARFGFIVNQRREGHTSNLKSYAILLYTIIVCIFFDSEYLFLKFI